VCVLPCVIEINKVKDQLDVTIIIYKKKKGKAVPLQAWTGPEGSRKLRFPDFQIS
jgi:hypothetical protein